MSNINAMLVNYASATAILGSMTESFLLNGDRDLEANARVFVKVIEEQDSMPEAVIKLKDRIKQKYNL